MEFKMNAIISTSMVIIVMFAFVNCRLINNAADNEEENYYYGVPVYTPSRECSLAGGICVQIGDCAKDQLAQRPGLCEDKDMGVECCYEVIPREAPCRQFGGACMSNCSLGVRQPLGIDCTADNYCCILVN